MSQQINLFNPAFARQKKIFTAVTMLRALAVLLVGCIALYGYGRYSVGNLQRQANEGEVLLAQKKARHAAAMVEFAPRQKSKQLEAEIAGAEAELTSLKHVSDVLTRGDFGDTAGFSEHFKALARQSNGDVWLTGVSIGAAGKRIGLQGRTLEASLVPAYVGRLTRENVMRGKSFGSLDIIRPNMMVAATSGAPAAEVPAPFLQFSLQAAVAEPGPAQAEMPAPQRPALPTVTMPTAPSPAAPMPSAPIPSAPAPSAPSKELL